jgi:hypothetical protein
MERVSTYLAAPEGVPANTLPGAVVSVRAQGLIDAVDFPAFVAGLIEGVFEAIVDATIEQMKAYAKLMNEVAKTVDALARDAVTNRRGRDFLAHQYPELFQVDSHGRIRARPGVDCEQAATRLGRLAPGASLTKLDRATIDKTLVPAARRRLTVSRQRLLSSMVLMGINRLVVTR